MNINYGDRVSQRGNNNVGIIKNEGPQDPHRALQSLVAAASALRGQVSAADQAALDEAVETLQKQESHPQRFQRALRDIAGIAAVVGQVGAPVIDAVRKVASAFGFGG